MVHFSQNILVLVPGEMKSFAILLHLLFHNTPPNTFYLPLLSPEAFRKIGGFLSQKLIYSFAYPVWKFSCLIIFIWILEIVAIFFSLLPKFSLLHHISPGTNSRPWIPLINCVARIMYSITPNLNHSYYLPISAKRPGLDKSNFIFLWKHGVFPYFQLLPSFYQPFFQLLVCP